MLKGKKKKKKLIETKEIARVLPKSESAVRVALSRARTKLRIQAQEDGVLELLRN